MRLGTAVLWLTLTGLAQAVAPRISTRLLPDCYGLGPFVVSARISGSDGICRDTLYYVIGTCVWHFVTHDSVKGDEYFYRIQQLVIPDSVRYYLVASDATPARGRSQLGSQ